MNGSQSRTKKGKGTKVPFSSLKIINGLAFDTRSGKFHRVTDTAAFIIMAVQNLTPVGGIIEEYAEHFEIPLTTAARDVELFLNDMSK